jgi:hypothetical protein
MAAMRFAMLSSPVGNITLNVSVFTCFHFTDAGSPPNSCAPVPEKIKSKKQKSVQRIILLNQH